MSSVKASFLFVFIIHIVSLSIGETAESLSDKTLNNSTINVTVTRTSTSASHLSTAPPNLVHNAFAKMDRGTIIRGAIVLSGITGLILMYAGIKAAVLRKKNQPKKYTLIDNLTSMEEPLFGAQNNEGEDEEADDDTLFTRK